MSDRVKKYPIQKRYRFDNVTAKRLRIMCKDAGEEEATFVRNLINRSWRSRRARAKT